MMVMDTEKRWLTVKEVADIAHTSTKTVYRWLYSRQLIGHKPGGSGHWKVRVSDLESYMQGHKAKTKGELETP